jgi:virginiamycin B lyase
VRKFALPYAPPYANLNTCAFDGEGDLWFTGQAGIYGKVAVKTGQVTTWDAPKGRGPYGICATPSGRHLVVLARGSYIARVDRATGQSTVFEPPTKGQGGGACGATAAGASG